MCIVAIAWHCFNQRDFNQPLNQDNQNNPLNQNSLVLPVLLLSNRDEFFARDTQPTHVWQTKNDARILAGQDRQSGGTWLGVNPDNKRWATVLNYREAGKNAIAKPQNAISRGHLVRDFLLSDTSPMQYAKQINLQAYEGFNFICGTNQQAVMVSNRGQAPQALPAGLHVFSNGEMQSYWAKTARLRMRVRQELLPLLQTNQANFADIKLKNAEIITKKRDINDLNDWQKNAFACLSDTSLVADDDLPDTGVPLMIEKVLSSVFIDDIAFDRIALNNIGQSNKTNIKNYGTRTSTVMALYEHTPSVLLARDFAQEKHANDNQVMQFLF